VNERGSWSFRCGVPKLELGNEGKGEILVPKLRLY
jgi:hypothetical protein